MRPVLAAGLGVVAAVCTSADGLAQPTPASAGSFAPVVLNGYSHFSHAIGTAPVYDTDAHQVGSMQKLLVGLDGQPSAIEIWLPSGHTFTVAASNASYDEQHNSVTVGLNDAQLGLNTVPLSH